MSQLIFPLLLLLIISKSSGQNEQRQTAAEENSGDNSRTDRAAIYREHFEKNGTEQQKGHGEGKMVGEEEEERQGQRHQRRQREGDGVGRAESTTTATTTTAKSRSRYLEFAETEFSRPSSYFPVPFVAAANSQLQAIPAKTLSQLIRQHIARNRMKQFETQNSADNLRSAQSREKEFRQTPFRRWPSNSTILSYAEKRRQWKTELKRRLKEQKVRTRIIPPLLISGGGFSSILTDREPENRYYVTYSPQTRTYQVSRRPPPYLYTTDQDSLPQQLKEEPPQQVNVEKQQEKEEEEREEEKQAEEEATPSEPTATDESVAIGTTAEVPSPEHEKHLEAQEESTTTTTEITATTVRPSLLVIIQSAELMENGKRQSEQNQRMEATKTEEKKPLKQIMFLDDYEQVQGEEEGNEMANGREGQRREGEKEGEEEEKEEEAFEEEENEEEEEMFFFKPSGGERRTEERNGRAGSKDPFRIVVHKTSKKL
ncbi:hypothetical protein niasHS_010219 [Heterodera schachtii]|uniref:Uncharacterized protein n=1 Tax=Heterodera schachtii TaxID=97005 RepID=A0ABD2J4E1_HETSC